MGKATLAACLALLALACGGSDDKFTDCKLGAITGTWRTHYEETDGNCGAIPDETTIFTGTMPDAGACDISLSVLSDDKCSLDRQFECPTTDDRGTQTWTTSLNQVSADRAEGSATIQLQHPTVGNCRSTYDITLSRL